MVILPIVFLWILHLSLRVYLYHHFWLTLTVSVYFLLSLTCHFSSPLFLFLF